MTTPGRPARNKPTPGEARRAKDLNKVIERLPRSGALFIVGSHAVVPAMRRLIHEQRGSDVGAAVRIIVAPTKREEDYILAHLTSPVFHDPFLAEEREHRSAIAQAWRH